MARIEIALLKKADDPRIRGVNLSDDGMLLVAEGFEELTLLDPGDIEKLNKLPVDQVTMLGHSMGDGVSTPGGLYILHGGITVTVVKRIGGSGKFPKTTTYATINAPTIEAFMDTFAMTLNNKLRGLELVPSETDTFRQITQQ